MNYYRSFVSSTGFIVSCDMIRVSFTLSDSALDMLNKYIEELSFYDSKYNYTIYSNFSTFSYRYLLYFKYDISSFVLGLSFNDIKPSTKRKCFIEFNPNKNMYNNFINPILDFIKFLSNDVDLVRCDIAIDIPHKRDLCCLVKDKRIYSKCYKIDSKSSDDFTEYLGSRNKNGFVKLYNKTKESNLDYDCTRLEITLDNLEYDNFLSCMPCVNYFTNISFLDTYKLNDTDNVLLSLLLQIDNPNYYIKKLGRGKQSKFMDLLYSKNVDFVSLSKNDFDLFILLVNSIIKK